MALLIPFLAISFGATAQGTCPKSAPANMKWVSHGTACYLVVDKEDLPKGVRPRAQSAGKVVRSVHTQGSWIEDGLFERTSFATSTADLGDRLAVTIVDSYEKTTAFKSLDIELRGCQKRAGYWQCQSAKYATLEVCPHPLVFPGSFDVTGQYRASSASPHTYTISCEGSAAKGCIDAGYFDGNWQRFTACTRAWRADYCGDGIPRTERGTVIDLYDPAAAGAHRNGSCCKGNEGDKHRCTKCKTLDCTGMCLEGLWNEKGASCLTHYRWVDTAAQQPEKCGVFMGITKECTRTNELLVTRSRGGHSSSSPQGDKCEAAASCDPLDDDAP
jgi:hypothetical protein